jgi:hypothetical protein
MRTARRGVAIGAAVVACLAMAGPASAGGSWIAPERPTYVPGDIGLVRGSFSSGSLEGRLADGPYYAYLLTRNVWIQRHRVPPAAIRLGVLEIARTSSHGFSARVEFVVPNVESGMYHIGYCNDPCTVDGIGDLAGSEPFAVAATREGSRLVLRNERLGQTVARITLGRQRLATKVARLDRELGAIGAQLSAARARADHLVGALAEARGGIDAERARVRDAWSMAAIALCLAVASTTVTIARARSLRRARFDAELIALTHDDRISSSR